MVAQINHQLSYMQWKIKLTLWFVYEWEKPPRRKPYRMNLRSRLPRIHYYHNKRLQVKKSQYFIQIYSWTLTPIPNWTCFVVTISPFNHGSQYVINQFDARIPIRGLLTNLRKMLATKFFSSSTWWRSRSSLITKPYVVQTQQLLE